MHTCFLKTLRKRRVPGTSPHTVISTIATFVERLAVYCQHVQNMVDALHAFETLVFSDDKLAKFIKARDRGSNKPSLRALLTTIPVSCIWRYGTALRATREQYWVETGLDDRRELKNSLDRLECIAKRIWPALQDIANTQRISVLQRKVQGISGTLLTPKQHVHIIDAVYVTDDHGDGFLVQHFSAHAVLLTDRIIIIRIIRNSGQLKVYKTFLFSSISFAFAKMPDYDYSCIRILKCGVATGVRLIPHSKDLAATWRRHLKRLSKSTICEETIRPSAILPTARNRSNA
ncbi:hypothetical protein THASP1DRAFT_30031 [Thamnocephalis sphaerospora]|uniref:DH domain-containing protein n=1 Tax=Thamnocephalis sphaerospora TaxID=78915 RepID=A0A4V1IWN4_9FUNG|nr:hypothetical protein THASP1DRAFT_30031 [Thamnocephalis sphaerospora]|eukprot:RKP08169.1 hypothetical protein THASP1DRAFT_30031 [Thamnocephalis sphaerospora]